MTAVGESVRSRPDTPVRAIPGAPPSAPGVRVVRADGGAEPDRDTVFAYWPIVYNAYLSLTEWNMIAVRPTLVGLANYARTLTDLPVTSPG